jgi:hypothetical protein
MTQSPMTNAFRESHLCRVEQTLGHNEVCTEDQCPFWEAGNDIRSGACISEELDLSARQDLAQWLEDLRNQFEASRGASDEESRRLFYQRLNAGRSD